MLEIAFAEQATFFGGEVRVFFRAEWTVYHTVDSVVVTMLVKHLPPGNRFLWGDNHRRDDREASRDAAQGRVPPQYMGEISPPQDQQDKSEHPEDQREF